jgi:tRNA(Ile)-lysidine synthase
MRVNDSLVTDFETHVERDLFNILGNEEHFQNNANLTLGVAVSGGADSIALLTALCHIAKQKTSKKIAINVITVNHRMRKEEETTGDALFVKDFCSRLNEQGYPVDFSIVEFDRGFVFKTAEERGKGSEESARFLRYDAFRRFAVDKKCDFICLAHNQNDQIETLLMRFLQGSFGEALEGIKDKRDIFIRPLLNISRSEIEDYLEAQNILWRTDATNFENTYFRNKTRNKLMPLLDQLYDGWRTSVLSGAQKRNQDESLIQSVLLEAEKKGCVWESALDGQGTGSVNPCVFMDFSIFQKNHDAVKTRLLYKAFNLCKVDQRVRYSLIKDVLSWKDDSQTVTACGIEVFVLHKRIFVKKIENKATESGFFAIIEDNGKYEFPIGILDVNKEKLEITFTRNDGEIFNLSGIEGIFCFRSRQSCDEVKTSIGNYKSVSDVFSDWHVANTDKDKIPLIEMYTQNGPEIKCIWGSVFGYKDWLVKS